MLDELCAVTAGATAMSDARWLAVPGHAPAAPTPVAAPYDREVLAEPVRHTRNRHTTWVDSHMGRLRLANDGGAAGGLHCPGKSANS